MEGVPASMSTVLTVIMPKKSLASAHSDCDTSNMISNGSEVLHNRSQVECISISFVNSGFPLSPWKRVEYIWAKKDLLLALGLNMKYSTLKRVSREYCTQFL